MLAIGLGVAILSSAIPYSLEFEALRRLPAGVFGVLMSLEPAMAALAGFVVLGEVLDARELTAIGLVVVASAGAARGRRGAGARLVPDSTIVTASGRCPGLPPYGGKVASDSD